MVSRFISFLNKDIASIGRAAFVLGAFSLLSQVFGLIRDRLLASLVGPSAALDVYYASFRIPDFLYNSCAVLFSVTVLIPFITEYLAKKQNGEPHTLKRFIDSVFTVYCAGMLLICGVAFICMPFLARLVAPGFSIEQLQMLVLFSRTMLISPFLFGLSNLFGSFAQVQKKFFSFAVAPVFYNLGILVGVILFRSWWGMYGVVLGVVLGALLYLALQIPALIELDSFPRLKLSIDRTLIKKIMSLSLPRTLSSSLSNITFLIMSALATLLAVGSVSVFQFAYNIQTTPLMIIGISYAMAAFPTLTKLWSEKNEAGFSTVLRESTRTLLFFSLPIMVLMIVLRAHIVRLLLGSGLFSWNDTRLVAASLACFSLSIVCQSLILLFVRAFFAMGDTKTPLRVSLISFGVTALTAVTSLFLFAHYPLLRTSVATLLRIEDLPYIAVTALPFSFSVGQIVNAWLLWRALKKRGIKRTLPLRRSFLHYVSASATLGVVVYFTLSGIGIGVDQSTFWGVLLQGSIAGILGLVAYGAILRGLQDPEIDACIGSIRNKLWRQKEVPLVPEQSEL